MDDPTKEMLVEWRKQALHTMRGFDPTTYSEARSLADCYLELNNRIMAMTQVLLDLMLLDEEPKIEKRPAEDKKPRNL